MLAKWPLLAMAISAGAAYAAYPYLTLYRLDKAIHNADAATLEALVDWPAVREGIKEDVCDLGAGDSSPASDKALPAFGKSFMRGLELHAIDRSVTPRAFLAVATAMPAGTSGQVPDGAGLHVAWAFFDSPRSFSIRLQPSHPAETIGLEMELRHGVWRVTRVWLPPDMLSAGSGT